jgi:uncharacterized protein (DUF362 family)
LKNPKLYSNMKNFVVVTHGKAKESTFEALKKLNPKVTGSNILVKPNLASYMKDNGENTDVSVVEGIVEYFLGKGDVTITEGCCGSTSLMPDSTYDLFEFAGYSKLEDKYGAKLFDLNTDVFENVKLYDREFGIAKKALTSDYLVSVPVLKTHEFTTISACVKNLMGCLKPEPSPHHETDTKWEIHSELSECDFSHLSEYWSALSRFEQRLIALYKKTSPKLGVVDAIVASEGDAPTQGVPVRMGLILTSENLISCDTVASYLMGIDPNSVGYLQLAKKQNLGEINVNKIKTNDDLQRYRRKFMLPSFINQLHKNQIFRSGKYL